MAEVTARSVFIVRFIGLWPIGASAIVVARCQRHAKLVFMDKLARTDEVLWRKNQQPNAIDVQYFCAAAPDSRFKCTIISTGEY